MVTKRLFFLVENGLIPIDPVTAAEVAPEYKRYEMKSAVWKKKEVEKSPETKKTKPNLNWCESDQEIIPTPFLFCPHQRDINN